MYERNQVLCDCANRSAYCLHDGKPGEGIKCRSRDDWYTKPCRVGKCPGPMDAGCCHKGDGFTTSDDSDT